VGTWWFLLLSAAGPLTAVLTLRGDRRRFARETVQVARDHRRAIDRTLRQLETRLHAFTADLDRIAYGGNSAAAGSPSGHSAPSGARSPAGSTGSLPGQSSRPTSGSAEDVPPGRDRVVVLGLGDVVSTASVHLPLDRFAPEQASPLPPPPRACPATAPHGNRPAAGCSPPSSQAIGPCSSLTTLRCWWIARRRSGSTGPRPQSCPQSGPWSPLTWRRGPAVSLLPDSRSSQ